MDEYTILEQVKIRLLHYKVSTIEGEDVVVFDHKNENLLLEQLIKQAKQKIKEIRRYPSDYTEEMIEKDLESYENIVVDAVVYYRSQAGESFMKSYTENGISRTWIDSGKLFDTVLPISHIS